MPSIEGLLRSRQSLIWTAFSSRDIAQYHPDKIVTKEDSDFIMARVPFFLSKSKEILAKLNEKDIEEIRKKMQQK